MLKLFSSQTHLQFDCVRSPTCDGVCCHESTHHGTCCGADETCVGVATSSGMHNIIEENVEYVA